MKNLKITIDLRVKGDPDDMEDLKEEVYNKLLTDIDSGDLDFEIEDLDEEEEDYA